MKNCLKLWVFTESFFVNVFFIVMIPLTCREYFGWESDELEFLRPDEMFSLNVSFVGSVLCASSICYVVTYFWLKRFVSDPQKLRFVFYVTGLLFSVSVQVPILILVTRFGTLAMFQYILVCGDIQFCLFCFVAAGHCWLLSVCFSFFLFVFLKERANTFRRINRMFARFGRLSVISGFVLCLIGVGLSIYERQFLRIQ